MHIPVFAYLVPKFKTRPIFKGAVEKQWRED